MSFTVKLLLFVVFLFVYGLWSFVGFKTTQKVQIDARKNKWFWGSEIMLILQVFIFIFIYLLSGTLNLPLAGVFLGAAQIGVIVTAVLLTFMGEATTNWRQRWLWAA